MPEFYHFLKISTISREEPSFLVVFELSAADTKGVGQVIKLATVYADK
jgi:hypothetical protein